MKHNKIITSLMSFALLTGMYSCKKDAMGILNTGDFKDTTGTLKAVSPFPIGFAAYMGDAGFSKYFPVIVSEGTNITPGNEMKHGSVVKNTGLLDFTNADALYNMASGAGLGVYGHTLLWHQQQNSTYLNGIAGNAGGAAVPNLYPNNGDFENADVLSSFALWNANGATLSLGNSAVAHKGNACLIVTNPTSQGTGSEWKVQCAGPAFDVTVGTTYVVTYWIKAAAAGGRGQSEVQFTPTGQGANYGAGGYNTATSWTQVSYNFTVAAPTTQARVLFDLGAAAGTYYVDDISVADKALVDAANAAAGAGAVAGRVDSVMKLWIVGSASTEGIVTHYKGKVKAWDVVNEILTDGGVLRTSSNTTIPSGATGYFFWTDYLGKDAALKAFNYAQQADPNALLFINDYNLESSKAKVDSLVAYVAYLKGKGAKIDGIGTQMHVNINTPTPGIDYMFQQLASTGLLVRVSELDVLMNPLNKVGFLPEPVNYAYQADMYKYIVDSYIKNVPAAQRHGVTIWGVDDADSWRYNNGQDLPLLFDKNMVKKPAYSGVSQALKAGK